MKKIKILGFRSNKIWKKIISVTYLAQWGLAAVVSLFGESVGKITAYDSAIDKIQTLIMLLILVIPHIFLSETPIRKKLPLFKERKISKSILGIFIVSVVSIIFYGIVENFHSKEYLADMENHDYQIVKQIEATCEKDGEINYSCGYCGLTKIEIIESTGHNMEKISQIEATCIEEGRVTKKCNVCGNEEEAVIAVLGHDMKEVSKTEATCENDGFLVEVCSRCNHKEEKNLTALGHSMAENSKSEATCQTDGSIIKKCEMCGFTEEMVTPAFGHNMKEISRQEPTEKTDGNIVRKCEKCGYEDVEFLRRLGKTEEEYKEECIYFGYEEIARNPDYYEGTLAAFRGEVIQVTENGSSVVLRMNITYNGYGYWEDTIYVEYTRGEDESRILEGDIVTVYGELKGIKTYTTVLGSTVSIPHLKAEYIEINY